MLLDWGRGSNQEVLSKLMPLIYDELHRLASRYMNKERVDHTLQTTALVHEAYVRLIDQKKVQWQNRAHFVGIAAQLMRRILIDHARGHQYAKRGGGARKVSLDEAPPIAVQKATDLLALDDALKRLAATDPRKSQVVELRFFGGLTIEETAEALKLSPKTVMRDWDVAKAWLYRELNMK